MRRPISRAASYQATKTKQFPIIMQDATPPLRSPSPTAVNEWGKGKGGILLLS